MSSRPYILVVLVSNAKYFELMVRKCPRAPFQQLAATYVIVDERFCKTSDLSDIVLRYHNPNFMATHFVDASLVVDHTVAESGMTGIAAEKFKAHRLPMKFGLPSFISNVTGMRMFFVDDDVLILQDPALITQRSGLYANYDGLSGRLSWDKGQDCRMLEMLNEVFDLDMDIDDYNKNRTVIGEFTFDPDDEYLDHLRRFWQHPFVQEQSPDKSVVRWRTLTQRFFSGYFNTKPDVWFCSSVKVRRPMLHKFPKALENRSLRWPYPTTPILIHYNACSWKDEYVEWFTKHIPDT